MFNYHHNSDYVLNDYERWNSQDIIVLNLPVSQNYLLIINPRENITSVMRKITKSRREFCCYLTRTVSFCSESNPKEGVWWQSVCVSSWFYAHVGECWGQPHGEEKQVVLEYLCVTTAYPNVLTRGWLVHLICWVRGPGKNVLWDLKRQIKLTRCLVICKRFLWTYSFYLNHEPMGMPSTVYTGIHCDFWHVMDFLWGTESLHPVVIVLKCNITM